MMKKITLVTLVLALGVSVYAQKPPMRMRPAKLPPKLETDLKLTPEQQIKVTNILKDRNFVIDSLAKNVRVRNGRFIESKMKTEMSEVNGKLYAMFTTNQQLVYAQYILDRQTQMEKGRRPGPPKKLPPPPNPPGAKPRV